MAASESYIKLTGKLTRGNAIGRMYLKLSSKNTEKRGHVLPNYSFATFFIISKYYLKISDHPQIKTSYPLRDSVIKSLFTVTLSLNSGKYQHLTLVSQK